jgi:ribosomal protein L15E
MDGCFHADRDTVVLRQEAVAEFLSNEACLELRWRHYGTIVRVELPTSWCHNDTIVPVEWLARWCHNATIVRVELPTR